jgi:ribosomal protein L29
MDFNDLKNKSVAELAELLAENRAELHTLRMQAYNKTLKQVHKVSATKKIIAQILMLLGNAVAAAKQ